MPTDTAIGAEIGLALQEELQQRLTALLARKPSPAELVTALEEIFRDGIEPLLAQGLTDFILSGWIEGAADVLQMAPRWKPAPHFFPPNKPPVPPVDLLYPDGDSPLIRLPAIENAVQSLLERQVMQPDDFYRLGAAAKQEAFTVSGELTQAAIEDIRTTLAENVRQGASLATFQESILETFETLPISESHLENVFRNNVNESYSQGHERILDHPMVADAFPYRAIYATHDARARKNHLALEKLGIDRTNVYYKDDSTFRRFRGPWDFGCRCGWAALSIEDAAKLGVREAQQWLETGIEPPHPPVAVPDFAPSPSWDRMAIAL